MVEATDELRRQIAEVIADYHGRMIQAHTLFRSYELAGELLPLVVAVVAEARTEGAIAELEYLSADTAKTLQVWTPSDLNERAAALRGVGNQNAEPWGIAEFGKAMAEGNQNAEPRWSANRLEEVLRDGLPDQNAEPEHADEM